MSPGRSRDFAWLQLARGVLQVRHWCGVTVPRTGGWTMRMLLAVPALALLSAPAMARPDHDAPPHAFKADVQVRMSAFSDGRGETRSVASDQRDAYDRAPSRSVDQRPHDSYGRESHVALPFKADVQQRLQNGDSREGNA